MGMFFIYLDFIPKSVVVEDVEVKWRCVYTRSKPLPERVLRECEGVLVDQGVESARTGVGDVELWNWYTRAVRRIEELAPRHVDLRVVVPDVFGNMEKTVERWERWASRIARLGRDVEVTPVLALQEPNKIDRWVKTGAYKDAEMVAIPMRFLPSGERCASRPRLCAEYAAKAAAVVALDGKWPHLFGPGKASLRHLLPMLGREVKSMDGMAYRLAASKEVRIRKRPGGPGGWMVVRGLEEDYLVAWLRGIFKVRRV